MRLNSENVTDELQKRIAKRLSKRVLYLSPFLEIIYFLALEHGPLYIDTAPWYGQGKSEAMLGKFLPDIPRDKFVIATKVARYETDPKKMFDFTHDRALASGPKEDSNIF